jgi:hypothetical protein
MKDIKTSSKDIYKSVKSQLWTDISPAAYMLFDNDLVGKIYL